MDGNGGVGGTGPERAFPDRDLQELAEYAAEVIGTPVALVTSLGEERQTFLANVGFGRDWTSLEESFCAYAVQQEGVFEVPDALADPRFRDNPLVVGEPRVRFYAGVPVRTDEGTPRNALCVLDTKPRELTDFQRRTLAMLARQVEARLALRRQAAEHEATRARRDRTLERADVATYDWDVSGDRVYGNDLLALFFGVPSAPGGSPLAPYLERVHPDDLEQTQAAIQRSLRTGERYETQYRVTDANGKERWLLARGDTLLDDAGNPRWLSGVVLDVTNLRNLASELESERERLDSVLRLSPTFVAVLRGEELRFEYANPAYLRLVGNRPTVGLTLAEAQPEAVEGGSLGQAFDVLLRDTMHSGEAKSFSRVPVRFQPNPEDPVEDLVLDFIYQPLRDTAGRVTGIFAQGTNVTEQARAERVAAERGELFRTVFEQAPDDAILVMDRDRTLTAWNPAAERICGWTAQEAIGQSVDLIFTPEDRVAGASNVEIQGAAEHGRAEDERWHLRKDGSRFWGSGTMNALHDQAGLVRGYLKVFRDATEQYVETRTLAFLRGLTDAVIELRDPDTIVRTAERMLGEHLGVTRVLFAEALPDGERVEVCEEWAPLGPSIAGVHRMADFGPQVVADFQAGRTHVSRDAEREYAPGAGLDAIRAIRAMSGISVPIHRDGRISALFVVHNVEPRDWTQDEIGLVRQVADRMIAVVQRARAERDLLESKEALEERVAERTAELKRAVEQAEGFNYSISHDLRTPLRAMVSTASILLEELGPSLDEEHRELLERQAHNANRLGRLIDELLRLSRLARVEVKRQPLDMTRKARSVFDELREHGRTNGCRFDAQDGMAASGDPELTRTVLHNLLGNACKFSPKGGVLRMRQENGAFSVSDEGVGFDMAHSTRMFLPFERLVHDSEFEGTGIGLANVKRIVERHGGRVWAQGEPGHGSTFSFTLGPEGDAKRAEAEASPAVRS